VGKQKRILLYGNSVILGCIGASLERADRFQITRLSLPLAGPSDLEALGPDAVLFDAENGDSEAAFSLLKDHPELLLLSVSPDGNVVRLWSGQQYRELSTNDLAALIEAGSSRAATADGLFNPKQEGTER
jgi:hypothetical protein